MDIFGPKWENHWEHISADWDARVNSEDIVLISGDISWAMKLEDAIKDLREISKRKGIKILVKGNHDYWWASLTKIRELLPPKMYILQNDHVKINNYVFAGSRGWVVPEPQKEPRTHHSEATISNDMKLYEREKLRLEMSLSSAKKELKEGDTLIGLMHFPPFNSQMQDSYFTDLFGAYGTKYVVYGHLHGNSFRKLSEVYKGGTRYYLTSCDSLENKLLLIE
ncbi:MAG: metallophosphoesterase [Firmicutes bacterium]|nr:metallophosphoesterase [Bacillota bacterium]